MKTSKLAVASFILSLLPILLVVSWSVNLSGSTLPRIINKIADFLVFFGVFLIPLFIFSLALGITAFVRIKKDNDLKGRGFALSGVIISGGVLAISLILVGIFILRGVSG